MPLRTLFVTLMLSLAAVAAARPIPVVLDTDIGTDIDDTWALAYLLRCPELDLRMVLTDTGDTIYRARVAARFLEVAGRTDVPVGIGLRGEGGGKFQAPWVRDYALDRYPGVVHRDGVDAFIALVRNAAEPVTLIAIGPVPNIAEALRRAPDIAGRVRFVGMHGSIDVGYGGGAPVAEANVRGDVEAFRAVLAADWLDLRITPLDTCDLVVLDGPHYRRVFNSERPELRALVENFRIWTKRVTWSHGGDPERRSSTLFDTVAVYMAFAEDFLEFETVPIRVTDDGFTVRDPDGVPVRAALRWKDRAGFLRHLTDRLAGEP
ncbi:MAG: nucleoside hydrolase [Verrucomicrobia bacterium]|nr:MAG: nucleoside hydrolase [Verrucomicrobiota bacterium]